MSKETVYKMKRKNPNTFLCFIFPPEAAFSETQSGSPNLPNDGPSSSSVRAALFPLGVLQRDISGCSFLQDQHKAPGVRKGW